MGKTLQYVKEFDFGPQKTYVKGYARGGKAASCYAEGGKADIAQDKAMIKAAVHKHEKGMHPGKPPTKLARGGRPVVEKATGERYPSRSAMVKHEAMETPAEQREEIVQRAALKTGPLNALRRRMPVAAREPMIPMKTGGQAKVATVMREYKAGELHSGKDGKIVSNPKQAIAIALSEARRAKKRG